MSLFDRERIRQNLRWLSKDIHVAGTEEQLALMDRLQHEVNIIPPSRKMTYRIPFYSMKIWVLM